MCGSRRSDWEGVGWARKLGKIFLCIELIKRIGCCEGPQLPANRWNSLQLGYRQHQRRCSRRLATKAAEVFPGEISRKKLPWCKMTVSSSIRARSIIHARVYSRNEKKIDHSHHIFILVLEAKYTRALPKMICPDGVDGHNNNKDGFCIYNPWKQKMPEWLRPSLAKFFHKLQ